MRCVRTSIVRALFVIVAVLAGPAVAETRELTLSRTGAAASPCPENRTCADDLARTVAGIHLVVHHQDTESDRITSLRIGAVDVGLGMYSIESGMARASLSEGTLDDHSAAVVAMLAVDGGAIVTVCGLGSPACTEQVRLPCGDKGCRAHLAKGLLTVLAEDGRHSYRVTRSYLSH